MTSSTPSSGSEVDGGQSRRTFLGRGVASVIGLASVGSADATAQEGRLQSSPSVAFEDQETDGTAVVVDRVTTDVDGVLIVFDGSTVISDSVHLAAGATETDVVVPLAEPISAGQELTVKLYESNGGPIASDTAFVSVGTDGRIVDGIDLRLIGADDGAGFNYPYYLYAPRTTAGSDSRPVLVEPNNTGTATDEFDRHRAAAEETARNGVGRTIADALGMALVVPVFPRPVSDPVDYTHYTHALDTETMRIESGPLERIDRQLLAMVEDARTRLSERSYPHTSGLSLNGFSAAGNFVNRFAALHPDRVRSVTAGGINGTAILPIEAAKGHTLNYQIGVADLTSITGEPFDLEAFRTVDQFLYMGDLDMNDTIPYGDAWSDAQREIAVDVYGPNMQRDRMPYCKSVYERVDASAAFRIYEDTGHSPRSAITDLVEFHRRSLDGETISEFNGNVGEGPPPTAAFEVPAAPTAGERIAFDAGVSTAPSGEILAYTWDFGDGETAAGEQPTHAFGTPGEFDVRLFVVDDDGQTDATTRTITVGGGGQYVLPGESEPAGDLDGDGMLEDVDGDGKQDLFDALTYYNHRESDVVQGNPAQFDYDGDGNTGTVFDALSLYNEIA